MSLKSKFILILLVVFVLFIATDFMTGRLVIFPRFVELEHEEARRNLERAVRAIQREIYHLDSLCHDWSAWDETYDFVENLSDDYTEANLPLSSFTDNNVNLIYICDKTGRVVWGKIYDLETEEEIELEDFPKDVFPKNHPLITAPGGEYLAGASTSGIFVSRQGYVMVSSRPILTSNNKGPVRGTFVMGRFLNGKIADVLVEQTRVDFDILPVQSDLIPDHVRSDPDFFSGKSPYLIHGEDNGHLQIYKTFPDIRGDIAFIVSSNISGRIHAIGKNSLKYAFISVLIAGTFVVLFMLLLIRRAILSPVARLTEHALSIGRTGDLSMRLSMNSRDEIGTLAREFDKMVTKLEQRTLEWAKMNEDMKKDIAERRRAEEALRKSEKYYRMLLYSMHDEIIVADRSHKITDANKDFLPVAGCCREDAVGAYCFDIYTGFGELFDRRHGSERKLREVFLTGNACTCRYEHAGNDASAMWADLLMSPLTDEDDNVTHVIIAMRDVSKEVQLETQLRRTQKMEAIGTLAGGIAHDFNNILMSIMINTEFAIKKSEGNAKVCESLELSLKAGYRARDLVEQILTFSRETSRKLISLKVSPILKETLKMLRSSFPSTIEILQHIEAESDTVLAAPAHIHQILFNLCTNAAHAMGKNGGTLSVSLSQEKFAEVLPGMIPSDIQSGQYLRLTVKDTGHGIPAGIIEKIFDPFFTSKPPGEGTGMGLAVLHGILSEIGGAARVRSQPGKGTAFDIFLPRIENEGISDSKLADMPSRGAGRLLIVDDEEFLIDALEKTLRDYGYQTLGKTNSFEAFELFERKAEQFDLVITDQTMPGMTGMELTEKLLSVRPDIPIILCTGSAEMISGEKPEGIREFVQKPLVTSELVKVIEDILGKI